MDEFEELKVYWKWCLGAMLVWLVIDLNPALREFPVQLTVINVVMLTLVAPGFLDLEARRALARRDYKLSNQLIGPAVFISEIMNLLPGNPFAIGLPFFLMMRAITFQKLECAVQAEKVLRRLISLQEDAPETDVMRMARAKTLLSNALSLQGKYQESEAASQEAVAAYERLQNVEPWTVAASLADLSTTLSNEGKVKQSLEVGTKALRIMEAQASDNDHNRLILLGMTLNNFAVSYENAGYPSEARALYERSLSLKLKLFGPNSKEAAIGNNNLGCAFINLEMFEEAKKVLEHAKELAITLQLQESKLWSNILSNCGDVHRALNSLDLAEDELMQSFKIRQKNWPHELDDTYENLGKLYRDKHDFSLSDSYFQKALAMLEKKFGVDHAKVARLLREYAKLCQAMNREEEAKHLQERVSSIEQKMAAK